MTEIYSPDGKTKKILTSKTSRPEADNGKDGWNRVNKRQQFRDNYDEIDWSKKPKEEEEDVAD